MDPCICSQVWILESQVIGIFSSCKDLLDSVGVSVDVTLIRKEMLCRSVTMVKAHYKCLVLNGFLHVLIFLRFFLASQSPLSAFLSLDDVFEALLLSYDDCQTSFACNHICFTRLLMFLRELSDKKL